MQSVLIRSLGKQEDVEVDADEFGLMDGDIMLLCSDGLARMATDPQIASTLLTQSDAQSAAERLVSLANETGGADNIPVAGENFPPAFNRFFPRLRRWMRLPPQVPVRGRGPRNSRARTTTR